MSRCLFAVGWHPGAVRAVAPVVAEAMRRGWHTMLATSRDAASIAQRAGVMTPHTLVAPEQATDAVGSMSAGAVVLAGVSEGDGAEKQAIAAARRLGLPSCGVLDNWGDYQARMTGTLGAAALPDVLAVMNDEARLRIAQAGFYRGQVIVTGHPGLDEFICPRVPTTRAAARAELGIPLHAELIVFASQPLATTFGRALGYDQFDAFAMLQAAVSPSATLLVALHPREGSGAWVGKIDEAGLRREYDPAVLYAAADAVTSCFSAMLTEAVLAGCPGVSIQPGAAHRDTLWTNACGATRAAYDEEQLRAALAAAMTMTRSERARRREGLGIPGDATSRVMTLVEELAAPR